jgi:hypothetical protein
MRGEGIQGILAFMTDGKPVPVYISYAEEDQQLRDQLRKHLAMQVRGGRIAFEDDLERATLILLLVSPGYLALCAQRDGDAERAMARRGRGEAHVVPILLQPCSWDAAPFGGLMPLPRSEGRISELRPVAMWPNVDDALRHVEREIHALVDKLRA